jgi:Domain of unknown function (DUF5069)
MNTQKLRGLAPDLNRSAPRSPYAALNEDFPAVAARMVDKCRAELVEQSGPYHFDCPLDRKLLTAAGLEAVPLREFIATGANDNEVAAWMSAHAKVPGDNIVSWSHRFRRNPLWRLLEFDDWLHSRRQRRTSPGG